MAERRAHNPIVARSIRAPASSQLRVSTAAQCGALIRLSSMVRIHYAQPVSGEPRGPTGPEPCRSIRAPADYGADATNVGRVGSTPTARAISLPAGGLRHRPSEGRKRTFDSFLGGHAVEAHADVCRIGNAEAAGASPAYGTTFSAPRMMTERRDSSSRRRRRIIFARQA